MSDKTNSYRSLEAVRLSEQLNRYVLKGDDCARVELLNKIINGEELTEALGYFKSDIKKNYRQKTEEDNKIHNLISDLERKIIKNRKGTMINELKEIINEYK